jgi:hypothetical protein
MSRWCIERWWNASRCSQSCSSTSRNAMSLSWSCVWRRTTTSPGSQHPSMTSLPARV